MRLVVIIFTLVMFCSCKQTHVLYLDNDSGRDAFVQVILLNEKKLASRDSIPMLISSDSNFKIPVSKDYSTNLYSFVLPASQSAILQYGKGRLDLSGKLVINCIDTIILNKSDRVFFENDDLEIDEAGIIIEQ